MAVKEVEILRGGHHDVGSIKLERASKVLDIRGDTLEIIAEIEPGDSTFCGLRVRRSDDGEEGLTIGHDGSSVFVGGIEMPYDLEPGQQTIRFRIFLDKSVIEVFVDDGKRVASNFIDSGIDDLGVEVFARGGTATITSIGVWEMTATD